MRSTMNRRAFLILGAFGIITGSGYLWWMRDHSPTLPDEMEANTLHLEQDVVSEDTTYDRNLTGWKDEFYTIIADADTAFSDLANSNVVSEFLDETDFDEAYVLLVQNIMQSEMELVLKEIDRTDDGVYVDIKINPPRGGGPDDQIVHSLLIRITDELRGIPESATVNIDGYI